MDRNENKTRWDRVAFVISLLAWMLLKPKSFLIFLISGSAIQKALDKEMEKYDKARQDSLDSWKSAF